MERWKDRWKDRWKEGQKDRQTLFYRALPAVAGAPNIQRFFKLASVKSAKTACVLIVFFLYYFKYYGQNIFPRTTVSHFIAFLVFTPCKAEHPLRGIALQEKRSTDQSTQEICLERTYSRRCLLILDFKPLRS